MNSGSFLFDFVVFLFKFLNMLRICLDVRNIKPVMTGLGRYALNLVKGIAELDSDNEYILLKNPSYEGAIIDRPNFREELLAGDISSMRSVLLHGAVINRLKPDVYHTLMHCLPFGLHCPKVVLTLHDLIWVDYPRLAFTNRLKAFYNRHLKGRLIKYAVNRADMVIAISQATRERAIAVFRVPPSKCHLIYQGIEERFLN
ncbi:MAG: glycosyltransferase, partial [bacterium]